MYPKQTQCHRGCQGHQCGSSCPMSSNGWNFKQSLWRQDNLLSSQPGSLSRSQKSSLYLFVGNDQLTHFHFLFLISFLQLSFPFSFTFTSWSSISKSSVENISQKLKKMDSNKSKLGSAMILKKTCTAK